MSYLFQKIKTSVHPVEKLPAPRLTLAAFGKHPGWDDHIPGIGVETDALAYVKQTLYVSGVGKQIDSGAWEKLEPEKRIEGFDHTFVWTRSGHVMLGELWSSTDRKGRSKYPMVLCLDGEGILPAAIAARGFPELERLRDSCKRANSAGQVTTDCVAAQNRIRLTFGASTNDVAEPSSQVEARRRFLQRSELGPDQVGLLRVLHELGGAGGSGARSRHLRVPMGSDSHTDAMLLWCDFFRLVVSATNSVLLIRRRGVDWLDVLIGEPEGTDFFCLQASLKALPLTTEIPYDLPPEVKQRWTELEASFLEAVSTKENDHGQALAQSGSRLGKSDSNASAPQSNRKWIPLVIAAAVLLAGVSGYLLLNGSSNTQGTEKKPTVAAKTNVSQTVVVLNTKTSDAAATKLKAEAESTAASLQQQKYDAAMTAARAAFEKQNYADAIAKADVALGIKPNEMAATNLKRDVLAHQQELLAQTQRQKQYSQAIEAGQSAYSKNDFTSALAQANVALGIKTNDPVAAKLRADAKSQSDLAAMAVSEQQARYETAMKAGNAALDRQDYEGAIAQADLALGNKTNDSEALKLKTDAKAKREQAAFELVRQQKFEAAMNDAHAALEKKDYSNVIAKADVALELRTNDVAAIKLKSDAQAAQREVIAQADREKSYTESMIAAQTAYAGKDYATAIERADAALAIRPNDSASTGLKKKATDEKDLQEVQACLTRGEFDKAKSLCSAHAGTAVFDELAKKLKEKESDKFDIELEVYLVRFDLLDPKKAKTSQARLETKLLGELPIQQRDQCTSEVEVLRGAFKASGRLDADREKKLNDLKKAINQHL